MTDNLHGVDKVDRFDIDWMKESLYECDRPKEFEGLWIRKTRRAAILDVLTESGEILSPKEIMVALHGEGRNDRLDLVTATVNTMARDTGGISRVGYGRYVAW